MRNRIAIKIESRQVMCTGQQPARGHFGVNPGAGPSVAESFEHEHRPPFAHHEPATLAIERAARLPRIVVTGQHAHLMEAGGEQWIEGLGTAGERQIALAVLNRAHRGQYFDQAARAGRRMTESRTVQSMAIGNLGTGRIRQPLVPPQRHRRLMARHPELLLQPAPIAHVSAVGAAESFGATSAARARRRRALRRRRDHTRRSP